MRAVLDPILHRESYNEPIESELLEYLKEVLYDPILEILHETVRTNAGPTSTVVREAISSGRVWYADGVFTGQFSAAISKELRSYGAKLDAAGNFVLSLTYLPLALRTVISTSKLKSEALHKDILNTLQFIGENVGAAATGLKFVKAVDKIVADLQKQFIESVSEVKDDISVPAQMTSEIEKQMREGLVENCDIEIKNFTKEQIVSLREKVQANMVAGGRADRLERIIQSEFGVGQRKARFIAENETSLAVSNFRELKYRALGSEQYVWSTSGDGKVRDDPSGNDHRYLNERTFSWSNPPIVDHATGRRRHPGCDYNCRCVARPILIYSK